MNLYISKRAKMENHIGYYRWPQIQKLFPVSRAQWFLGVKEGIYPKPQKFGRMSLWRKTDIHELLKANTPLDKRQEAYQQPS